MFVLPLIQMHLMWVSSCSTDVHRFLSFVPRFCDKILIVNDNVALKKETSLYLYDASFWPQMLRVCHWSATFAVAADSDMILWIFVFVQMMMSLTTFHQQLWVSVALSMTMLHSSLMSCLLKKVSCVHCIGHKMLCHYHDDTAWGTIRTHKWGGPSKYIQAAGSLAMVFTRVFLVWLFRFSPTAFFSPCAKCS